MRTLSTSFVLGYHGCDRSVAERLLAGSAFRPSDNAYDWLGPGVYFWEANPRRGIDFVREKRRRGLARIRQPTVVGAVIELGNCLDLTTAAGIAQTRRAHKVLIDVTRMAGLVPPRNSDDQLRRSLDCAVFRTMHDILTSEGASPLDTLRGVFVEGRPIYDGGGIHAKTHIQLCVRNPECIKAVFRVRRRFLVLG